MCRCGRTVADFVEYYGIYVCPCVAAFAREAAREQELHEAEQGVLL